MSRQTKDLSEMMPCCRVCLVEFDNDSHSSRLLSCGHTLCRECLFGIKHTGNAYAGYNHWRSKCPTCRAVIASGSAHPRNFDLDEALDVIRYMQLTKAEEACCKECKSWHPVKSMLFCVYCYREASPYCTVNSDALVSVGDFLFCGPCAIDGHVREGHEVQKYARIHESIKENMAEGDKVSARELDDVLGIDCDCHSKLSQEETQMTEEEEPEEEADNESSHENTPPSYIQVPPIYEHYPPAQQSLLAAQPPFQLMYPWGTAQVQYIRPVQFQFQFYGPYGTAIHTCMAPNPNQYYAFNLPQPTTSMSIHILP
ncbi:unnamed protein product [Caenorhabditis sp. 36 PRJEB53466]|nr:unnamed protein product [Caenorhabditis sp. 36 PRJEB53466]